MPASSFDPRCDGNFSAWSPLPDACLEVIDTDRPHQTDTPHVVPAGHAQLESAIAAVALGGKLGAAPGDRAAHVIFFEDAYKLGVASGVDLQLLFKHAEYVPRERHFEPPGPYTLRGKLSVVEEDGAIPALTLVPVVMIPVASSQPLRAGPLAFLGWELAKNLELEVNVGAYFAGARKPAAAIVLASALTLTVVGDFRVFIDGYTAGYDAALGTGALWAFARDMQVDVGTYIGVSGDEPQITPFVGASVRR